MRLAGVGSPPPRRMPLRGDLAWAPCQPAMPAMPAPSALPGCPTAGGCRLRGRLSACRRAATLHPDAAAEGPSGSAPPRPALAACPAETPAGPRAASGTSAGATARGTARATWRATARRRRTRATMWLLCARTSAAAGWGGAPLHGDWSFKRKPRRSMRPC